MNEKVKQAVENVKNIKVGTMVLNDLFGQDLKVIETAFNDYEEDKEELIAEQHRLFDLAKEQANELNELRDFAIFVIDYLTENRITLYINDKDKEDLVKKVVEKYGEKEY